MDADIATLITRRLKFYRTRYEIWMIMISLVVILLSLAINMNVDNMDGVYRINKPFVYFGTMAAIFVFCYGSMKVAFYPKVRELKALLLDLEAQVRDETAKVEDLKRKWRLWAAGLAILALLFLIIGVIVAIKQG